MTKRRPEAEPCPCGSGAVYRECCQRYHLGGEPTDPERLVRSRFSAYALGEGAYLARTLHPDHAARAHGEAELARELSRAKRAVRYRALVIHEVTIEGERARVLFTARVFEKGRDRSFVELSRFERTGEGWRYLDGELRAAPGAPAAWTIAGFEAGEDPGRAS